MQGRFQHIFTEFLSRFGIKNSKKTFAILIMTVGIAFLGFAGIPILIQFYDYYTNKNSIIAQTVDSYSIFCIVIGLIFIVSGIPIFLIEWFGYSEHKKRIDSLIIRDWDKLVDPDELNEFLIHRLGANHSLFGSQIHFLSDWVEFHRLRENKLKNKKMKFHQQELLFNLYELRQFTMINFSSAGENLFRLAPNFKRHSLEYEKLEKELIHIVQKCVSTNKQLRSLIDKKIPDYNSRLLVQ